MNEPIAVEARTFACVPCQVTWKGDDPTCWSCGGVSDSSSLSMPVPPGAAQVTGLDSDPGVLLTRWGSNYHEAAAMGLPDPRSPRSGRAA